MVDEEQSTEDSEDSYISCTTTSVDSVGTEGRGERDAPITVCITLNGKPVSMEVDTGAAKTIMPEKTFRELWPGRSLDKTDVQLQSYLGEPIPVLGSALVHTNYQKQTADLPLIVVKGNKHTLLGRNWLYQIRLNWGQIKCAKTSITPVAGQV